MISRAVFLDRSLRLEPFFDAVLIEGELGFGKPDARVFAEALSACDVLEHQAWMVGERGRASGASGSTQMQGPERIIR